MASAQLRTANISYTAEAFWAAWLLFHLWAWWGYKSSSTLQLFYFSKALGSHIWGNAGFPSSLILLTCCVEVKVGRLIGNVPCSLQARSLCCHFACISLGFVNIHFKWALWDVLPSKQDWNLETESISLDPLGRGRAQITTSESQAQGQAPAFLTQRLFPSEVRDHPSHNPHHIHADWCPPS